MDDASWVMGFLDIIDPAIDSVKKLLKLDQDSNDETDDVLRGTASADDNYVYRESFGPFSNGNDKEAERGFDLDAFVSERLSLDPSKLDFLVETARTSLPTRSSGKVYTRPFPSR